MQTNRIEYIDRLKGFAILCVILGHYVFHALGQKDIISEIIGSFQMPLFMFMSGYVLSSAPSWKKCCKKVITFMLPMLIVGGIFALFSGSTLSAWIQTPFKHGYWYLYVLSVFYVLLSIMGKIGGGIVLKIISAVVIFILLCALNYIVPARWNDVFSLWMLKLYWPFFICAYFVRQMNVLPLLTKRNYIFSISLIGYVVGFLLYRNGHPHLFHLNAFLFIAAIIYVFMMSEQHENTATKALSYFGRQTLEIYILHFFIIHLTSLEMVGNWFVETGNVFLEIITGIIYSVIVAYICIMAGKLLHLSNFINNIVFGCFVNKWK